MPYGPLSLFLSLPQQSRSARAGSEQDTKEEMTVPAALSISILILSVLTAGQAFAETPQSAQASGELKKLSLEELQELEVTSVSRRPERLSETA